MAERENIMGFELGWVNPAGVNQDALAKMYGNSQHVPTIQSMLAPIFRHIDSCRVGYHGTGHPLTILSMFDGIGAGLCSVVNLIEQHKLWNINLRYIAVEIDKKCQRVLKRNFIRLRQKFKKMGAIGDWELIDTWHDVTASNFGTVKWCEQQMRASGGVDIVLGGWPCNNASGHNRHSRNGLDGECTKLFYNAVTIIKRIQKQKYQPSDCCEDDDVVEVETTEAAAGLVNVLKAFMTDEEK